MTRVDPGLSVTALLAAQRGASQIADARPTSMLIIKEAGERVVVVANSVVVVSSRVELVVLVLPEPHGQLSGTTCPTALRRHTRASVADIGNSPEGAQMHAGEQLANDTAAFNMNRQSVETGTGPLLRGCEQSPRPACTGGANRPSHNEVATRTPERTGNNLFPMTSTLTRAAKREKVRSEPRSRDCPVGVNAGSTRDRREASALFRE